MYYTMIYMPNLMICNNRRFSHTINRLFRLLKLALSTLLIQLMLVNAVIALESDRRQPIDVTADRSELDARTGFTHIIGSVVIRQGSLEVNADDAEVYVESGRVTRVLLNGEPATWKQQMDSLEWMDARAAQIDYQVNDATILLSGNAQVNHPQGQITGDKLTYDLDAEKLRGDSSNGGRITIRLEPEVIENEAPEVVEGVMEEITAPAQTDQSTPENQAPEEANNDDNQADNAESGELESKDQN